MLIEFPCHCGHRFRTHRDNAGKSIVCPNCSAKLTVPSTDSETALVANTAIRPPAPPAKASQRAAAAPAKKPSAPIKTASTSSSGNSAKPRKPVHQEDELFDDLGPMEAVEESEEELPTLVPVRRKKSSVKKHDDDDDKKEKKTKSKKGEGKGGKLPLVIGSLVAGVLLLGTIGFFAIPPLVAGMKNAGKTKVPKELERFQDSDINFSCLYPKGWTPVARGGTGNVPPSVRMEQGRVKISFRASQSGAAIQDIAQATAGQAGELPDELQPVARVHDYQKAKISDEMPNYTELGPPEKIDTGLGEGRLSTFVASGDFGSKIFGYRATLLSTQFQWNCICQCSSQREFEAYKPLFKQIIESAGR